MTRNSLLALSLTLLLNSILSVSFADQQLDSLKNISAAGAPLLTLKMLDQAQPGIDQDLYEWILWEQERYRILAKWKQWNDLLIRIEGLPKDLPEQFIQQASTYRIRAYIALGQSQTAQQLIRQQLWQSEAGSSTEYQTWRKLVIETYLQQDRIDDARIAMLKMQQDFDENDQQWILLRARVLMQSQRYDEAIQLLSPKLSWQTLAMKLLAEYKNGQHDAKTLWKLIKKRVATVKDDDEQLATYWSIAAIAARKINPVNEVIALEARLGIDTDDIDKLYRVDADQLWQAYQSYAQLVGNRSELLYGDDQSWLKLAMNASKKTPIKARSLLALLINKSAHSEIKQQAASAFLQTLDFNKPSDQHLLHQLFNKSSKYRDADLIPVEIRFRLVDMALKNTDIAEASRLMFGLTSIPTNTRQFDWLLRRARVLILGGQNEQGDQVLDELIGSYTEPHKEDTDHILQVLFDLQTIKADEQAIRHFRQLLNLSIDANQRREIMFWMADSFKALGQFERAALLYLQSAMFAGPDAMDPWAQTARFNAAESLQKAGLVDDARRIYQGLLAITEEPARRSLLKHNIQQLWLNQNVN
jgi:hypothetical protein